MAPLDKSLSDPSNLRPISVLPMVTKIFEQAAHKQVYRHLTINNLFSPYQSGFRQSHSTSSALLDVSNYIILKNIDEGNVTGAVFLDVSKAFDLINHS